MAYKPYSVLAFLLIFNFLLAIAVQARDIPTDSKTKDKKLQPELLMGHDGSVLIPGIGRVMLPPKVHKGKFHKGFNPFTYNPITGSSGGGSGIGSVGGGSGGGSGRSYVPGGDDTLVPNPGVEVPNPGSRGNVPARPRP